MKLIASRFAGVWIIEPRVFVDRRGWFVECWNRRTFAEAGIEVDFVQDNHSKSSRNVLRGLHFQAPPQAQAKLVRCVAGRVWDVVVDIRRGSPTYGQWEGVELDAEAQRMLFVPAGLAHGFCVLSETAEIQYKCSAYYAPELSSAWPGRSASRCCPSRTTGIPCWRTCRRTSPYLECRRRPARLSGSRPGARGPSVQRTSAVPLYGSGPASALAPWFYRQFRSIV